MQPKKEKGFTLVEIMVVVTIVGLLAVIAVPIFIRTRINANEQMLRGDLRSFTSANESYQTTQNPPGYAADIQALIDLKYLDSAWGAGGRRHGYLFTYAVGPEQATYSIVATPAIQNITGINRYCVDHTGAAQVSGNGTGTGCAGGTPVST
jgi:prepilin-type N-terminal cleavage/methylation domain-containing protein